MTENFEQPKSPSESPELDLEKKKFTKRVAELFEVGLESNDIYAYHGTTAEAIKYLATHGRLPSSGSYGAEVFYVPEGIGSSEGDQQHAEHYASWNALKYFILERIPFRPSNMEKLMYMFDDEDLENEFLEEAAKHGVNKRQLHNLIREAERTRKGVLVTLSRKMVADFEERAGVDVDQRSVITPQGLPIEYITGIEPLGQYEWDELEKLQKEADKKS